MIRKGWFQYSTEQMNNFAENKSFQQFQILDLRSNDLIDLSFDVDFPNVHTVYLNRNHIASILPIHFENPFWKHLTKIDLSEQKAELTKVPRSLFMLENLKFLNLSKNAISCLPDLVKNDEVIEEISSSQNSSTNPENVSTTQYKSDLIEVASNICDLDLSNNKLTTIPETFLRAFPHLEKLKVNDNCLQNGIALPLMCFLKLVS